MFKCPECGSVYMVGQRTYMECCVRNEEKARRQREQAPAPAPAEAVALVAAAARERQAVLGVLTPVLAAEMGRNEGEVLALMERALNRHDWAAASPPQPDRR